MGTFIKIKACQLQASVPADNSLSRTSIGMGLSYAYLLDHAVKGLLAELAKEENVKVSSYYDKDAQFW